VLAHVDVTFLDNSVNETGFILQRRATAAGVWTSVAVANRQAPGWDNLHQSVLDYGLSTDTTALPETLTDNTRPFVAGKSFQYRVIAFDEIGTQNLGTFPNITTQSDPSNVVYVKI
jgi:hypothetical protein